MSTINIENLYSTKTPKNQAPALLDDQCIDMGFITKFSLMSDKWIYKQIKDGKFPAPIKLGRKSVWLKSEFEDWMMQRILHSRGGAKK